MGFLGIDLIKTNNEIKVKKSFEKIKKDLDEQKEWIEFLHEKTQILHKDTSSLKHHHIKHRSELNDYLVNLSDWISYLHENHTNLQENLEEVENNLKVLMSKELNKYHTELIEYLEELLITEMDKEKLKAEIVEELKKHHLSEYAKNVSVIDTSNDQRVNYELNTPEKELLSFLFNENNPLTYNDIASKTKKSINTIRVYMNSLKTKGCLIEEFKQPNGVKIFSLKNKEKVKKLYNII